MKLKRYQNFITENLDQAKSIIQKKMDAYEKLKTLLGKNLGYIGKFTQFLMEENVPYQELEKLFHDLSELKSKNAAFDINGMKYEKVIDKLQEVKEDLSIKSLTSQFPGEQKKLLKDLMGGYYASDVRSALYKVSQKDYKAFISKISRYKTKDELSSALKIFSKESKDDHDHVVQEVKKMKSHIVYDKDNILIIKIECYDDIKLLGSNTSWCIVRSEHTFNSYVRGRYQFVLYNYALDDCDADFKIGFTLNKDLSIHACHNILDHGAKQTLRNLLNKNDIKFENLIPKKDPLVYDLNRITTKTVNGVIDQLCEECKFEEIPIIIKKIISFKGKSRTFVLACIKKLCNRYYANKKYVTQVELDKIDPELFDYASQTGFRDRIVLKEYNGRLFAQSELDEEMISIQIDNWSDTEICKIEDDAFDHIYGIRYGRRNLPLGEPKISKELVTKISDRINQAYKNVGNIREYRPDIKNDAYFGFKLLKETELVMLLFNTALGRKESTPDYNSIVKHLNDYNKVRFASILKLPIDLDESSSSSDLQDVVIGLVIKKDYNKKAAININRDNYNQCLKLIEHLKGYKILFSINSKFLKEQYRYEKDDIIHRIIKQFRVTRVANDEIHTEGDVSIQAYIFR